MDYLRRPVAYLDDSDFDDNGNLINPSIPVNKPVFIMFQANFCGHCKVAKPHFQKFAENNQDKFFVATIQADSNLPEVQKLRSKADKIYPNLIGFPSYIVYYRGKKIVYNGGRRLEELQSFADSFFQYYDSILASEQQQQQPNTSTSTPAPSTTTPVII